MKPTDIENEPELQQILWACYECSQTDLVAAGEGSVCYSSMIDSYKKKFRSEFHPAKLYWLTKLGFLKQAHASRGGNRRYYTITNRDRVLQLLKKWKLK